MEQESNEELAFLETSLLKKSKEIYTYRPIPTLQFSTETSCEESDFFSWFNRAYFIITNKDYLD